MRTPHHAAIAACAVSLGLLAYVGCAAGPGGKDAPRDEGTDDTTSTTGGNGGGTGGTASDGGASEGGSGGVSLAVGVGGGGGMDSCAEFTVETQLDPAAMTVVLDRSASMNDSSKWFFAKQAIIKAIDKDVFDSMWTGMVAFPDSFVDYPQCLCDGAIAAAEEAFPGICEVIDCCDGLPQVSCGLPQALQVPIQLTGPNKSFEAPGVRYDIDQYLKSQGPLSNNDDGSPIFEALQVGYEALKNHPNVDDRMLILVTDGGFSCTSLSEPERDGYEDLNGCPDWEYPSEVNDLIKSNYEDAVTPVRTFVVGVPGSDSNGEKQGAFDTAPYSMLLALSTYAVSGSPDTVPAGCDSGAVFDKDADPPVNPCHFDLSNGGMFDADALADAFAEIRSQAFGCVYPLPDPPMGESIDLAKVNVKLTIDGTTTTLPKRSDPDDTCEVDGCWDYVGPDNDIELIGKACDDASAANEATVAIEAGCETILN